MKKIPRIAYQFSKLERIDMISGGEVKEGSEVGSIEKMEKWEAFCMAKLMSEHQKREIVASYYGSDPTLGAKRVFKMVQPLELPRYFVNKI